MTVYGDLLFLINFSMDFLCFYLSCLLLRERLKTLRVCVASIIGGVYSVAALFIDTNSILAFSIDILILLLMCAVVYRERGMSFSTYIKRVLLYFVVSSLLGGFMTAVFSVLNRIEAFGKDFGIEEGIDVWVFALLALISSMLTLKGGSIFKTSSKKEAIIEIESEIGTARLKALVDTGNLVCEPISGKSVIFARLDACGGLFSEDDYLALENGEGIENMPTSLAMRMRPIFSNTVNGGLLLPAIRFRRVRLLLEKRKKDIDVYIAFMGNDGLSGYDAIISDELIT